MESLGDIKLNGKPYRIDIPSYRMRDVVDFSPRASTPGGSVVHSDLMLYQPLMQTDWRHGFGWQWYEDAMGYMRTEGNIDTRNEGVAMLYTDKTTSDTEDFDKIGSIIHKKKLYTWGKKGIRRYNNGAWETIDFTSPKVNGTPVTATTSGLTSCTADITVPNEGANPALLVMVALESNETISNVTYGGLKLTRIGDAITTTPKVEAWLINDLSDEYRGVSKQVEVTISSAAEMIIFAVPLSYVSPTDADITIVANSGTSAEASSVTIASSENDLLVDMAVALGLTVDIDITEETTQTEILTKKAATANHLMTAGTSYKPGAASSNMAWSWTDEGAVDWASLVVSIKAPSSSMPVNVLFSNDEYLFAVPKNGRIRRTQNSFVLTLSPNEVQGWDTYITEGGTVGAPKDASLIVGTTDAASPKSRNALLKFTQLNQLPAGAVVTAAKLKLYVNQKSVAPSISVNRVLKPWAEGKATWTNYNATETWTTPGCLGSGTDYAANEMYSGTPTTAKDKVLTINLDLTQFNLMQATNYGMVIRHGASVRNSYWDFASASTPDDKADHRPTLEITYKLTTEWVDTGKDSNAKDFAWFQIYNGRIYAGERTTNLVHYSTESDLSDLEGGSTDADVIVVGLGSVPTVGAISYGSYFYVARNDGLWQVGEDKIARRVLDFSNSVSPLNFKSMAVHNGYLVFPIQNTIYQWNGARVSDITPRRLTDQFPYTTYGEFENFLTVGNYLYCTARTNEEDYTESLLCFDGTSWHKLCDLITSGAGSTITMLTFDPINYYLWIHKTAGTSNTTYYIPIQINSAFPYASFPTTGTHAIISSRWDMGFRRVTKSTPSILVETSNCSSLSYLKLYYNVDGKTVSITSPDIKWNLWGEIAEDGITELRFPNTLDTLEFKYIQLKVVFITTTATQSPVLEGLTLRFLMRPDVAFGWNMNLPLADNLIYGGMEYSRTAQDIWTDLKICRDSKAPLEYVDLDRITHKVYITSMTSQAVERNIDTEEGGIPSIERMVNLNLVEAR